MEMKFIKHIFFNLFFVLLFVFVSQAQTILINGATTGGFEGGSGFAANGWTVVNGSETNRWYCVTPGNPATPFAGSNCAYISNTHPAGGSYAYTVNSASVVHFYRDVTIPAGEPYLNLQFRYKGQGESTYDFIRVFVVPTTTTPVAGTQLTAGQIGATYYNLVSSWTTANINFCGTPGSTIRLVFSWRNDNSLGTQPPGAIDNIHLTSSSTSPGCPLGTGVTNVASLPYSSGAGTTCGSVNDLTSANTLVCGSSNYLGGEDRVWIFTPTASGNININLTSGGSYTGLMLYEGCPLTGSCTPSGGQSCCVTSATGSSGNKTMSFCAKAGTTYYLILDSWPSPTCNSYSNLTISAPTGTCVNNEDCLQSVTVCTNSSFGGGTSGVGCYDELNTSNQGCLNSGENNSNWYIFSPSTSGTIAFTISPSGSQDYDFAVWGPYSSGSTASTACNSLGTPLRCSFAYGTGDTGLGNGATDFTENASGDEWVAPISAAAGEVYVLMIDNFTADGAPFSFSWTGTASMSCTVLPVELLTFSAKNMAENNLLEWQAASEMSLFKYVIETSSDGIFYTTIGERLANGNQGVVYSYSYFHEKPPQSINYYRLKEIDLDGSYKYSNTVLVDNRQSTHHVLEVGNVYPNPGEETFILEFNNMDDTKLLIELSDIGGKIIFNETVNVSAGKFIHKLNLSNFAKGIYLLKIFDDNNMNISTQKLMVK
jgi:hypothetical protein